MKITSSNKETYYEVSLELCECMDFVKRLKAKNRLSCNCNDTFNCKKCSCRHQRENLIDLKLEALI